MQEDSGKKARLVAVGIDDDKARTEEEIKKAADEEAKRKLAEEEEARTAEEEAELKAVKVRKAKEAELEAIKVREDKEREEKLSKEQEKPQNSGHYEDSKKGDYLFWGFLLCAVVLSAPLGGGFGFLLAPTQAASFGLLPFWKRKARKRWVVDPVNPDDKLLTDTAQDKAGTSINHDMLANPEMGDELLAENVQQTEMDFVLGLAEKFGFKEVSEKIGMEIDKAMKKPGANELISAIFTKNGVGALMNAFANSTEENRQETTQKLFDGFTKSLQELAESEQFKETGLADYVKAGVDHKQEILNNMIANLTKGELSQLLQPFSRVKTSEATGKQSAMDVVAQKQQQRSDTGRS